MIFLDLFYSAAQIQTQLLIVPMMTSVLRILILTTIVTVSACSTYKLDVQQGNVVTQEQLAQLNEGMTYREVQHILGSPLIKDPFHADRWDYYFSLKEGNAKERKQQHITIYFEDERLKDIDGDLDPATVAAAGERIVAANAADDDNFLVRLWKKLRK